MPSAPGYQVSAAVVADNWTFTGTPPEEVSTSYSFAHPQNSTPATRVGLSAQPARAVTTPDASTRRSSVTSFHDTDSSPMPKPAQKPSRTCDSARAPAAVARTSAAVT